MAEENGFDITKLIFQNICVWQCGAVVKEFLASLQINRVRLPAMPHFLFLCILFLIIIIILFSLCFLALFFLLACFSLFLLLTLLIMHLDQYI